MKYPEFLQKCGIIGFIAPSFGCNIEPYKSSFQEALQRFEKMGYQTLIGPNCYEGKGIGISNLPNLCAKEFEDFYCSSENDVLLSCGGGELMCEILKYIDFEKIRQAKPKWFQGYSDNTNLTYLLTTMCDTASIYGPGAPSFGMRPWHQSQIDSMAILTGERDEVCGYPMWELHSKKDEEHPYEPYNLTEKKLLKTYPDGQSFMMEGRLIGGCMDCLRTLIGTCYDQTLQFVETYQKDGFIWFLECCDLNVMDLRRTLWQMERAGWFQHVKGFLIGRPLHYNEPLYGLDQYEAVLGILRNYEVPVVMDADLGHLPPMLPIICGAKAQICVDENITIKYFFS